MGAIKPIERKRSTVRSSRGPATARACGRQRAVDGDAERDADRATKADMEKSMINAAGAMTRDPRP
jgi:hypothetical protein